MQTNWKPEKMIHINKKKVSKETDAQNPTCLEKSSNLWQDNHQGRSSFETSLAIIIQINTFAKNGANTYRAHLIRWILVAIRHTEMIDRIIMFLFWMHRSAHITKATQIHRRHLVFFILFLSLSLSVCPQSVSIFIPRKLQCSLSIEFCDVPKEIFFNIW